MKGKWLWFFVHHMWKREWPWMQLNSTHKTTDKSTYGLISPLKIIALTRSCSELHNIAQREREPHSHTHALCSAHSKCKRNKWGMILWPLSLDTIFSMFFPLFRLYAMALSLIYCYRYALRVLIFFPHFYSIIISNGARFWHKCAHNLRSL